MPRAHPPRPLCSVKSELHAQHPPPHVGERAGRPAGVARSTEPSSPAPGTSLGTAGTRDQAIWMHACKHTWWPGLGRLTPWPRRAIALPCGEPSPGPAGPRDGRFGLHAHGLCLCSPQQGDARPYGPFLRFYFGLILAPGGRWREQG